MTGHKSHAFDSEKVGKYPNPFTVAETAPLHEKHKPAQFCGRFTLTNSLSSKRRSFDLIVDNCDLSLENVH